jgi:hypothetical protein
VIVASACSRNADPAHFSLPVPFERSPPDRLERPAENGAKRPSRTAAERTADDPISAHREPNGNRHRHVSSPP